MCSTLFLLKFRINCVQQCEAVVVAVKNQITRDVRIQQIKLPILFIN